MALTARKRSAQAVAGIDVCGMGADSEQALIGLCCEILKRGTSGVAMTGRTGAAAVADLADSAEVPAP